MMPLGVSVWDSRSSSIIREGFGIMDLYELFFLVVAFAIVSWIIGHFDSNIINTNWEKFAGNLGLDYYEKGSTVAYPKVEGIFRDRSITVKVIDEGYGEDYAGSFYTNLSINTSNPKDVSMYISPKFFKRISTNGMKIENLEFDRTFSLKGNNDQEIRRILGGAIQFKILALNRQKGFETIRVIGKKVYFEEIGVISSTKRLEIITRLLIDIVEKLEGENLSKEVSTTNQRAKVLATESTEFFWSLIS